jgi:small subunit ribosomal protein S33
VERCAVVPLVMSSLVLRQKKFTQKTLAVIDEAARVVFGNRPVVPYRTGFKLLKQQLIGPVLANYYLPDQAKYFRKLSPGFQTDLEERRQEKLTRLRARNKGPPKKGEGSRAKKGKKK